MSDIVKISYNEYNDGDILPSSKVNEIQKCIQSHETVINNSITLDNIKSGTNIEVKKDNNNLIINNTQNVILDFPEGLTLNGTMTELIDSLDEKNIAPGHVYFGGVRCSDLPNNMVQAELKIEIVKNSDGLNVYYFTIISTQVSPYMWTGTGYQGIFGGWQARTHDEELKNYVKNTDYASTDKVGVVKIGDHINVADGVISVPLAGAGRDNIGVVCGGTGHGINVGSSGALMITPAVDSEIANRSNQYKPIVPSNLNTAVKAVLTDSKRISNMTEEEKENARNVIGVKTPYEIVKENGYTKTEIEFNKDLAAIEGLADWFANL